MKVEIYSREAMERRLQEGKLYDTAVICFYDPPSSRTPADYAPINYDKKCSAEYSIAVHDLDIEVLPEYGLTYETYLPEVKLLAFYIKTAVDCNLNIVCQCEYGQSRSAACAAAIKEYYEHGLWKKKAVKNAVKKGWITADEYKEITGEDYE